MQIRCCVKSRILSHFGDLIRSTLIILLGVWDDGGGEKLPVEKPSFKYFGWNCTGRVNRNWWIRSPGPFAVLLVPFEDQVEFRLVHLSTSSRFHVLLLQYITRGWRDWHHLLSDNKCYGILFAEKRRGSTLSTKIQLTVLGKTLDAACSSLWGPMGCKVRSVLRLNWDVILQDHGCACSTRVEIKA